MENCRKSAIFYSIWANFVALSLKMSSKCNAPIEKNSKLPEDVFLETLKIVRAQNSFFCDNLVKFYRICMRLILCSSAWKYASLQYA